MTNSSKTAKTKPNGANSAVVYSAESDLVDFILGITFEIWEQRQVEQIYDYYAENVEVYSLDGMVNKASVMVDNTHKTLASFPDRYLLGDDVITTGTTKKGFSSHRLISPMTNHGDTIFGRATGKRLTAMNIADCEVNDGVITREWLVRDNMAVVEQLGFDPINSAGVVKNHFDDKQLSWLASEHSRTIAGQGTTAPGNTPPDSMLTFANKVLKSCWLTGDPRTLESLYAPYCVLHRAPLQRYSGREEVLNHYADWRSALPNASMKIDHICSQPFDQNNHRIAVRWSVAGVHEGVFAGSPASGKPVYILGVTHWNVVDGRIAAEWTVFDELAMLAQTLI